LHNPVAVLNTNNEQIEKERRKIITFTIATREIKYLGIKKKPRNKLNKRCEKSLQEKP
jgi:hypothetical protein